MHTKNNAINMESIAIALAGNFEIEQPTQRQAKALAILAEELSQKYGVTGGHVIGHAEASPDKCPGKNLKILMDRIKSRL